MKKQSGVTRVNDDEWYTPAATADKVAAWAAKRLPLGTPILCPADLLPDGSVSEIPKALKRAGFTSVRVTRNLPVDSPITDDWQDGEVVITNPPFSLLVNFRKWQEKTGARFILLARGGTLRQCWTIPELGKNFCSTGGRCVAAAWFQNIENTARPDPSRAIGNCLNCERKSCPKNSMTGHLEPRQDRPLYGWCVAAKIGVAGSYCPKYTIAGKIAFIRYFHKE